MSRENAVKMNLFIATEKENTVEDYVLPIFEAIRNVDETAQSCIGHVDRNRFCAGIDYAIGLMKSYMLRRDSMSADDINAYLSQLENVRDDT